MRPLQTICRSGSFAGSIAARALFENYACAAEPDLMPGGEYTGGSADSGFTATVGASTLCGTGPLGEKAHSPDEVHHPDTLVPRADALALVTARLPACPEFSAARAGCSGGGATSPADDSGAGGRRGRLDQLQPLLGDRGGRPLLATARDRNRR